MYKQLSLAEGEKFKFALCCSPLTSFLTSLLIKSLSFLPGKFNDEVIILFRSRCLVCETKKEALK